jgi:hypothetical protein
VYDSLSLAFGVCLKKLRFTHPSVRADITVKFLPDGKMLGKLNSSTFHYMLQPGHRSGEIDLHKTNEKVPKTDPSKHERLGAIRRVSLEELLKAIGPRLMEEFIRLWRPIRLKSVIGRGLFVGARIPTYDELANVKKISIKSGLFGCEKQLLPLIKPPEFYDDVLKPPFAPYFLFKYERREPSLFGVIVPHIGSRGRILLKWAKIENFERWRAKWEPVLWRSLQGHRSA